MKKFRVPYSRMGLLKLSLTLLGCEFRVSGHEAGYSIVAVNTADTKAMLLLLEAEKE